MSERKRIIAYHDSYKFGQRFVVYEDGTCIMFGLLPNDDTPDTFFPNEKEYNKILTALFQKIRKDHGLI